MLCFRCADAYAITKLDYWLLLLLLLLAHSGIGTQKFYPAGLPMSLQTMSDPRLLLCLKSIVLVCSLMVRILGMRLAAW